MEWKILNYRRMFKLSYKEVMKMPYEVFIRDLEMLSAEAEVSEWRKN